MPARTWTARGCVRLRDGRWPVGYGAQPLYNLRITVLADTGATFTTTKRIGYAPAGGAAPHAVKGLLTWR